MMRQQYRTLRYYDVNRGLGRLVDLDRIKRGESPIHLPELASLNRETAEHLYVEGLQHALADLIVSSDEDAQLKSVRIVAFCKGSKSVDGLESLFVSAMSVLQTFGPKSALDHGFGLVAQLPIIERLGVDRPFALAFDASARTLSGLSFTSMRGLLDPTDISRALRAHHNVNDQVARGRDQETSLLPDCRTQITMIAGALGAMAGQTYGKDLGAVAGGTLGGLPGLFIGYGIGRAYGEILGSLAGGYAGYAAGGLLCGGSGETPAAGSVPTSTPTPDSPTPSPPPSPRSNPSTQSDTPPPILVTGGAGDDPPKPDSTESEPETLVATPVNPYIDPRDPTDRDAEDEGPYPGVAPIDMVARFQSATWLPERFVDEITQTNLPNTATFHLLPRFALINGISIANWGSLAPVVHFAAGDLISFAGELERMAKKGNFVPDPMRPGQVMLNPEIINPTRDMLRDAQRQAIEDVLKSVRRDTRS